MDNLKINRVLNNNVLIVAHPTYEEVILIGKGIGFNRKKGEEISRETAEKMFVLRNEEYQKEYKQLLPILDENMQAAIISVISFIQSKIDSTLNERIHVSLTDHLLFASKRIMQGMQIANPFNTETKVLYPFEYSIARDAVTMLEKLIQVHYPEDEIGFIALHIHSAMINKNVLEVNKNSQLISQLLDTIESYYNMTLNREDVYCSRLIRHLRYTIDRVLNDEHLQEQEKIADFLKLEYPEAYNLSWKLIKMIQQTLKKQVYQAEAVYLTLHLQRLEKK